MTIQLRKGEKINLSKENRGLSRVTVGLGWDENSASSSSGKNEGILSSLFKGLFGGPSESEEDFDCDAVAILLNHGHFTRKEDLVFYNNLKHDSGSVVHMGDNLTGNAAGEKGDAEQIQIDLKSVPNRYDKILLAVGIYEAHKRHQHFGMIKNAYIRIMDATNGKEMCRYNLTDNYPNMTHVVFGELFKDNNHEWQFKAVGESTMDENVCYLAQRYI